MKLLSGLLSIVGLGAKAPTTSGAPAAELSNNAAAADQEKTAEYATAGEAAGENLTTAQVQKRNTIFGN